MSVRVYKRGSYTKAIAKYENLPQLRVGVTRRNSPRGEEITNAKLLALHQYGGENFPARRPLSVLETSPVFLLAINKSIKSGDFNTAGAVGVKVVQAAIIAGLPPPVTDRTMKERKVNKTDNTPLRDTDKLLKAISFDIKG